MFQMGCFRAPVFSSCRYCSIGLPLMGLGSVLQTAFTGMSAAETAIGVIGHNLANSQTDGFKQSRVSYVTQGPVNGSAPNLQFGSGVTVASVDLDTTQGSLVASSDPLDVGLQGDGFLIVEGPAGERLYTRDGNLSVNADGELVTTGGHRVLGYGVDADFELNSTELAPLRIPDQLTVPGADGTPASLVSVGIGSDGSVFGRFTDGNARPLGQIRVARFANPSGLIGREGSLFAEGPNSGAAVEVTPGVAGSATLVSGVKELSNTDVAQNLIDLVLARNQFRASGMVFAAASGMLDELLFLTRR